MCLTKNCRACFVVHFDVSKVTNAPKDNEEIKVLKNNKMAALKAKTLTSQELLNGI